MTEFYGAPFLMRDVANLACEELNAHSLSRLWWRFVVVKDGGRWRILRTPRDAVAAFSEAAE